MKSSRLAILAVLAIGIAIVAATQTCREREPAATAQSDTKVDPAGVSPRADTPMDLRERDRLREDQPTAAGVIATPDAPTGAEAAEPAPVDPRRLEPPAEQPTVEGPPASPTVEAAMAAAKTAAQDEVAKVRGEMRRKCWDGAERGGVGSAKLGFSVSFNAEGQVIASAVQQGRDSYVPGLDTCLGPFAHALEIPAPGETVSVEVELELP
jgi:hypothetical protein